MNIKSLRVKTILLITILITLTFLGLSVINFNTNHNSLLKESIDSTIPLLRDNIYSEIEKSFLPALGTSTVMANDAFLISWIEEREISIEPIMNYLNMIKSDFNYLTTFFVSETTGYYYTSEGINKTISRDDSHDIWYYTFIESGREYDLDVDRDEVTGKLTIFINHRVSNNSGDLLGVTGVGIEMKSFRDFLIETQKQYERLIYLTDETGIIQAHSSLDKIENAAVSSELLQKQNQPVTKKIERDGESYILSSKYIEDIDWFLIVEQKESSIDSMLYRNTIRTITTGFILLVLILITVISVINIFSGKLEQLAITDELTGAYNRREFNRWLERSLDRKQRKGTPLSLISLDIDHFKNLNDQYGHIYGDNILKELSKLITERIRPSDIYCRLGGDEFIIVVEGSLEESLLLANRVKRDLSNSDIDITLSMGVYEVEDNDSFHDAISSTDKALYMAKESGRNTIYS